LIVMLLTQDTVRTALKAVKYPGFNRDIVAFGLVKEIQITGETVRVFIHLSTNDSAIPQTIGAAAKAALLALPGITTADIELTVSPAPVANTGATTLPQEPIPGVKYIIAVGSGKGGVGKSTVAANLAMALQMLGQRTGLCDCDIYGPSLGLMFDIHEAPYTDEDNRILPIERYGLQLMSMSFFLGEDAPAILRGPMVTRYTQQFLRQVAWRHLDFLILDLPPGTGDIQLTIVQTVALAGAVIVTTPQEMALIDARKAVNMFHKVNVTVLGLIENMSYFLCPDNGKRYDIFGTGGGRREATRQGVPLLAELPLEIAVREAGDFGTPFVRSHPESATGRAFAQAARELMKAVGALP
jgi:ATP-binding protein involved in chromosome partitioning